MGSKQVEKIITQEMTRFTEWHRGREVTPVIKDLRQWAEGIADEYGRRDLLRFGARRDNTYDPPRVVGVREELQ